MWVKIHRSSRTVVAICDDDLLGKKFDSGIRQLDITQSFFKGAQMSKKETIDLIRLEFREGSTFNIVGKESINCAQEVEIIEKKAIKKINGIPFILVV